MRVIFRLTLRAMARGVDRSTGSPLGRWTATALAVCLPALLVLAGRSNSSPGIPSASADVANLLIVSTVIGPLVALSLTIAWRPDARLLEHFRVTPLPSSTWQFALLAPALLAAGWVSVTAAAPLADNVMTVAGLGRGTRFLVLVAALAMAAGASCSGLVAGLLLRRAVARLPLRWRATGRSIALIGSTAGAAFGALRFWTWVNRSIADHEVVALATGEATLAFDVVTAGAGCLAAGIGLTALGARAALALGFTSIEQQHTSLLAGVRLGSGSCPAYLGLSWLRNSQATAHLAVSALLLAIGVGWPSARWLTHAALLLAAAGFVGFAPGNVAMRPIVRVGARDLVPWFARNGSGALVSWVTLCFAWGIVAAGVGEAVMETVVASTLVMAMALVVGGAFVYAYRTPFGAELAYLVIYCLGAVLLLALVDRGWFVRPLAEVLLSTMAGLLVALGVYSAQSATDRSASSP